MNDLVVLFNDSDFQGFKTILNSRDCSNLEDIITNAKKKLVDSLQLFNFSLLVSKVEKKNFYIVGSYEEVIAAPIKVYAAYEQPSLNSPTNQFVPSYNYGYDYWNIHPNYGFMDAIIGQNP
tara:strand:+ start:10041 stop:10403 length:363 start_codon:yes stop_codon:yes gene_type:complete